MQISKSHHEKSLLLSSYISGYSNLYYVVRNDCFDNTMLCRTELSQKIVLLVAGKFMK